MITVSPPLPPDIAAHSTTRVFQACSERPMTMGGLLEDVCRRYASRIAIVYEDRRLTYSALHAEVRALAKGLIANGLHKGTRVGLLVTNRPEFVIAMYAIAMAGGIVVPIHTLSTAKEREFMLAHSDCAWLLLQRAFLGNRYLDDFARDHPALDACEPEALRILALPYLCRVWCLDAAPAARAVRSWASLVASGATVTDELLDARAAAVDPSDDVVILHTSGSTGRPKGVVHRHRAACLQQWRAPTIYGMAEDERVWSVNPLFWSAGFAFFPGTLTIGACMVMQERMEPAETLALIERERVTTLASAVTTLAPLAEHPDAKRRDLSAIRHLPTEATLRQHLAVEEKIWGPTVAWGQSETFASCTYVIHGADPEPLAVPGGYPMPGMTIKVVDPETGRDLPQGETGEIVMKGPQVMRGYLRMKPEDCFDAEGFVRSRDAGLIDSRGRVQFTGRLSNLIRTSGANVSPLEVEAALARWGKLQSAFVIGVPDERVGEAVVACVIAREDEPVGADAVEAALREELASYKRPRHVLFFAPGEIPMTGSNKPQLGALRELAMARLKAA